MPCCKLWVVWCALIVVGLSLVERVAAQPLAIQFKNDSGLPDSQVYIGFVGPTALNAFNKATGTALSKSEFGSEHWYTLDTLAQGIDLTSFSGRIYVGYGSPWSFTHSGYEPSSVSASDPNYLKRYDKVELTYFGNPADVANTTTIDYFSIPLALNVYQGGTSGTLVGSLSAAPMETTFNALRGLTSTADGAVVRDGDGNFVRVIGPSAYPPPPGLPTTPYDNFDAYLDYLQSSYIPTPTSTFATIKGQFAGVGPAPLTPETKPQSYEFAATIDSEKNITLTGGGTEIGGGHTLFFKYEDLNNPAGIYGANPNFYLDGAASSLYPQNDVYGWVIGELLAGFNIGAIGSTVEINGQQVGEMQSNQWFTLTELFSALQPNEPFYNRWAAALYPISDAYNFAYTDRFAHVVAPLDPSRVDTLEIVFVSQVPEPTSGGLAATAAAMLVTIHWRRKRGASAAAK